MDAWPPRGGALAGNTTSVSAWHCQPPSTNLSLETTPPHPAPHPTSSAYSACLETLMQTPKPPCLWGHPPCQLSHLLTGLPSLLL